MRELADKVTIVTEASSGRGHTGARAPAAEGAAVVVTDIDDTGRWPDGSAH